MKPSSTNGSVLVYLVVLLLLFGVLGVIITSLFTTSTSSSATPNQVRRAYYVTESAMRYAFSELRNSDFDPDVINTLNNTKYSLSLTEKFEFDFNIFGPWFDANEAKNIPAGTGDTLTLKVPQGKLTDEWMAKNPNGLWAVNYDSIDLDVPTARNVASWSPIEGDDTLLTITLATGPDDFNVDQDDSICLAVRPTSDQTINDGENLYVAEEAKDFFPEYDGAINIKGFDYVYKRMVHEPANNWVKLENVTASAMPNVGAPSQIDVSSTDFIVLSPRNHIVIPTGIADAVTVSGTLENALNIYDLSAVKAMARKPDIDFKREDLENALTPVATTSNFITVDNSEQNKTINIGSNVTGQSNFGAVWFNADKAIGGKQNVCQAGACEFGRGVRVFFTLDYSGTADGLTFALINATNNTTSSSGGDRNMGELLGYAGDSRKVADPTLTTDFLDVTGAGLSPPSPGLHPPKMALEFDTWTNNNTLNYCQGTTKLNSNRNDPFDSNRDAVQYVFWGFTSLAMPCRNYTLSGTPVADHPSYDDNRHDSGELDQPWPPFTTGGDVRSTPTVADDGTGGG
ncbi:MAG: hypothetical protein JSW26_04540, partial [Desulfobacterales bacterium]